MLKTTNGIKNDPPQNRRVNSGEGIPKSNLTRTILPKKRGHTNAPPARPDRRARCTHSVSMSDHTSNLTSLLWTWQNACGITCPIINSWSIGKQLSHLQKYRLIDTFEYFHLQNIGKLTISDRNFTTERGRCLGPQAPSWIALVKFTSTSLVAGWRKYRWSDRHVRRIYSGEMLESETLNCNGTIWNPSFKGRPPRVHHARRPLLRAVEQLWKRKPRCIMLAGHCWGLLIRKKSCTEISANSYF